MTTNKLCACPTKRMPAHQRCKHCWRVTMLASPHWQWRLAANWSIVYTYPKELHNCSTLVVHTPHTVYSSAANILVCMPRLLISNQALKQASAPCSRRNLQNAYTLPVLILYATILPHSFSKPSTWPCISI